MASDLWSIFSQTPPLGNCKMASLGLDASCRWLPLKVKQQVGHHMCFPCIHLLRHLIIFLSLLQLFCCKGMFGLAGKNRNRKRVYWDGIFPVSLVRKFVSCRYVNRYVKSIDYSSQEYLLTSVCTLTLPDSWILATCTRLYRWSS